MRYIDRSKIILFVLIFSITMISSCSAIRKATYPPDFVYLEQKTVTSSMHQLAISVDKLNRTIEQITLTPTTIQRDIIIDELNNMEKLAIRLGAGTQTTNHLLLDQHIDLFRSDIIKARRSVESEPVNFYPSGKLAGSCISCHVLRYSE